ncbi:uncharacterized protein TRIADDRAFT_59413 [Trichoplax adhaerens]|uniref:DUF5580 domain-containing protein n=1 Tax=Trichoplax adhaerens TaxID=10228 RepID=B3S503_TRIAD|nr:predicted protein [Trichoplax adhaerens]EDV22181.1 predicted protein [Trichoplax adhaerens]|eukprot:XP_002115336.1 predicted protein [Trichoplax adhaerens]
MCQMLRNRQEQLENKQPLNQRVDLNKIECIEDVPWIDRYMELAIALDAADINNKGIISKTEAMHLINKYNVSHKLNYDDKIILSAIDNSLQPENNKHICIGNLLEELNISSQN